MRYAIDSKGTVLPLPPSQNMIRFIPIEVRAKELVRFTSEFAELLNGAGINTQNAKYCYMIQPLYASERLVYFTRTELSSSSQAVRMANELDKHPELLNQPDMLELLQSIFQDTRGTPRWYLISVGYVELERNLYDCKRINLPYHQPVFFHRFQKVIQKEQITKEELELAVPCEKYRFFSNDINFSDREMLIDIALERDIVGGKESVFDMKVYQAVKQYRQMKFSQKDVFSNTAAKCLKDLNTHTSWKKKDVYIAYDTAKKLIKSVYKNAYGICYKDTRITAYLTPERFLTMYVGGTRDRPLYIIDGNFLTIEQLKDYLMSLQELPVVPWFADKVQPYIEVRKPQKASKAQRNVLQWNKKQKKKKPRKEK